METTFWEEMYRSRDQVFSGNPNEVLVAEVAGLTPGRALDLGCGEGADAHWLARRGWQVTAIDTAETALRRAAEAAPDVAGRVTWTLGDPAVSPPEAGVFDLVTAHFFPLLRQPGDAALRALLAAVAPGGTLLYVGHDLTDLPPQPANSPDPYAYYQPAHVAALLDDAWIVEVDELRPRATPSASPHSRDVVLRARRLG